MAEIDNLLKEDRSFPPSDEWKAGAIISDPAVYERAAADPEAFWAAFARELDGSARGTRWCAGNRRTRSGSSAAS